MDFKAFFLAEALICNSSVVISRKVIDTIGLIDEDPKLKAMEDNHYYVRVSEHFKACYIDEPLVSYRYLNVDSIQIKDGFGWYKSRLYLINSIRKSTNLGIGLFVIKICKLTAIYLLKSVRFG
jgi:hypothetical protein